MEYKRKGIVGGLLSLLCILCASILAVSLASNSARSLSSNSGTFANLTVWDSTDPKGGDLVIYSGNPVTFYANFSNITSGRPINTTVAPDAECNISILNWTGTWQWSNMTSMAYNASSRLYEYEETLRWKNSSAIFNISCNATDFDFLYVADDFVINNTAPEISTEPGGKLEPVVCYEDSCGTYDFSANCSDVDINEVLIYGYGVPPVPFSCFSINQTTGIVDLTDCDNNDEAVNDYQMVMLVKDSDNATDSATQSYTVTAVNDKPAIYIDDCNSTATEDVTYICDVSAGDEEDGTDDMGNLKFWTNTTWFNINLTSGEVNFTPLNSQVGNHTINISVNDSQGSTDWEVLHLEIQNTNDPPILVFACYNTSAANNKTVTEGSNLTCWLNATDVDPGEMLRFTSNASWFNTNSSPQASDDGLGNFSLLVNFITQDEAVGSHIISITVNDTEGQTDSSVINVTIIDLPDTPVFLNVNNGTQITGYENVLVNFTILAWDNDTYWNSSEYISFSHNRTDLFNFTYINTSAAMMNFTPNSTVEGTYMVRIKITDGMGNLNFTVINLTIYNNSAPFAPNISFSCYDTNTTFSQPCYYNLSRNVTEPDGDSVTYLDFAYFFDINNATSIINFTANDSLVGMHDIMIRMKDEHGTVNSTYLLINVINVSDSPVINKSDIVCYENIPCFRDLSLNVTDEDNLIPGFNETLNFSLTNDTININFLNFSPVTGIMNFTPNYTQSNKTYMLNFSVTDSSNRSDSEIINLTIFLIDDAPNITYIHTNRTAIEGVLHVFWINATDYDSENLTFSSNTSWFLNATPAGGGPGDFSVIFNFTPGNQQTGSHSIQINVSDGSNNVSSIINFIVQNVNTPPSINWWRWTIKNSAGSVINTSTTLTNLTIYENMTLIINHSTSDADFGDVLHYYWLIDGAVNSTSINLTYKIPFDGNMNRSINVTLIVYDDYEADMQEWNLSAITINRPPKLLENIPTQTWPENTNKNLNLSEYLWDSDMDNLIFSYNLSEECRLSNCTIITFSGSPGSYNAVFKPAPNWYGVANVSITANDSEYNATSNKFMLNVTYIPPIIQIVYIRTSSGGGGNKGNEVASLNLQISPLITIEKNRLFKAPVLLSNSGNVRLKGITLSAYSDTEDLSLQLLKSKYEKLDVKENASTEIMITLNNVTRKRYYITVTANTSEPVLNESAMLYLEPVPTNKTNVEITIKFAKDLFEDNPECLELMELIFNAEEQLSKGNIEQAQNLTGLAIKHCRDILQYGQPTGRFAPADSNLIVNLTPIEVAEVIVFILAVWVAINWIAKQRAKSGKKAALQKAAAPGQNTKPYKFS